MESLCPPHPRRADDKHHSNGRGRPSHPTRTARPAADSHARRDRRRLRRYRHLAALCDEGKLHRPASDGGRPAACLRRAEPDLLVADADRHGQICRGGDARRQSRRRRLACPAGADLAQPARPEMDCEPGHDGRAGDLPVLWRRDDHAGHFRPVGGRRADHRRRQPGAARHPDLDRYPGRPVPDPGTRHGTGRRNVRADRARLFRGARCPWRAQHRSASRYSRRLEPYMGPQILLLQPEACLPRHGIGVPRGDGRRDALCRHGPFRAPRDRLLMARPGLPLPDAQLFGPGRLAARQPGSGRKSLLSDGARMGPPATGRHRHPGDDHRQPGGNLRRFLGHAPGGPARLPAAPQDPAHQRQGRRPDLHSGDQLDACW